jgi:hypothetical protein
MLMLKLEKVVNFRIVLWCLVISSLATCGPGGVSSNYHDPEMDFAAVLTVAVMPFENLSRDQLAGARVREAFANALLSTGALYVIPSGEVARGTARAGLQNPTSPSTEEMAKLAGIIDVDAIFTGTVLEYGAVRSGSTSANVVAVNVNMIELQTRKVVWTASSTKGGITIWDRLLGSGGEPMNDVTRAAVNDLIDKLFR